jgi:hypothetical protein
MGLRKEVGNVRMLKQGGNPNILHNVQPHVMFLTMSNGDNSSSQPKVPLTATTWELDIGLVVIKDLMHIT